jgi:hypothetical protein
MKHLMLLFLLIGPIAAFSQENQAATVKDTVPTTSDIYETDHAAWAAWRKIDSAWMDGIYWECLKTQKLKMDCSRCEDIMIKADMQIDSSGKLVQYRVVYQDVCGRDINKKLEDCFMEYFLQLIFPIELRNHIFKANLGTGLKC